ncbi:MAG: FecR domain-containing protein [Limisphaerales bacterium]
MKQTPSVINGLLVCGVAFAMVSTLSAQTTMEQLAKVVRMKGVAHCQVAGGGWQDIRVGTILRPGAVIQTGLEGGSYVDVALGRGGVGSFPAFGSLDYRKYSPAARYSVAVRQTVVRLYPNTVVGLDKLMATETGAATVTQTELDLRKGHILGNVKKLTAGSEFKVRFPKGVALVRGAVFDMTVDEMKEVKQGNKLPGDQHWTFTMGAGTGLVTYTGPDGNPVTMAVQAMQSLDSSNPLATMGIATPVLDAMNTTAAALSPPSPGVVALPDPGESEIFFVQPVRLVTPTAGVTVMSP